MLSVVAALAITSMTAAYADKQYTGLTDEIINRFFGVDGISTTQEQANAKMLNDIFLTVDHDTSLIDNIDAAQFWEDVQITMIRPNTNNFELGIHDRYELNENEIRKKLSTFYPDAAYTLKFMHVEFGKPIRISELPSSVLTHPDDTESMGASGTQSSMFKQTQNVNHALTNGRISAPERVCSINISPPITVKSIAVTLNITHEDHDEMRSYLQLSDGTMIKLFDRPRNLPDGLYVHVMTNQNTPSLQSLIDKTLQGNTKILVGDYYSGRDTGTVISCTLEISGSSSTTDSQTRTDSGSDPSSVTIAKLIYDFFTSLFGDNECNFPTDNCMPMQAGMIHTNMFNTTHATLGTIGLGGLETNDGRHGFIIAGHSVEHGFEDNVYHSIRSDSFGNLITENTLGRVYL
jgi:subtilisin-like proprotein convertase family protein